MSRTYFKSYIEEQKKQAQIAPCIDKPITIKFSEFAGFVVYGWRRDEKYLYIGFSKRLYNRLVTHHVIGRYEKVQATDVLDIWQCQNMAQARDMERQLIIQFNPMYNATVKIGHKRAVIKESKGRKMKLIGKKTWPSVEEQIAKAVNSKR